MLNILHTDLVTERYLMMYRLIYRNFATCSTAVKESRGILPALVALSGAAALGRKPRAS